VERERPPKPSLTPLPGEPRAPESQVPAETHAPPGPPAPGAEAAASSAQGPTPQRSPGGAPPAWPGYAPAAAAPAYPGAPGFGAPGYPPPAYASPGYLPAPYPVYPYPAPYAPAAPPAWPPPPADRAWPAQSAVGRMRMAALLAVAAFALAALQHVVESATGVSDIPGTQAFASRSTSSLAFLLRGAELTLVAFAVGVGAAALAPLRQSATLLGEPGARAMRRGAGLLAGAATVTTMATVVAWVLFSTSQQALPGMGVGSDPGLNRLFGEYRVALAASAAAGAAASFPFVLGLERVWGGLLTGAGRKAYARFARAFTLAAAVNAGLVIVLFFGVVTPATLEGPPAQAWSLGLLALGPAAAAASLLFLRRALEAVEAKAKELSLRAPAPKA